MDSTKAKKGPAVSTIARGLREKPIEGLDIRTQGGAVVDTVEPRVGRDCARVRIPRIHGCPARQLLAEGDGCPLLPTPEQCRIEKGDKVVFCSDIGGREYGVAVAVYPGEIYVRWFDDGRATIVSYDADDPRLRALKEGLDALEKGGSTHE